MEVENLEFIELYGPADERPSRARPQLEDHTATAKDIAEATQLPGTTEVLPDGLSGPADGGIEESSAAQSAVSHPQFSSLSASPPRPLLPEAPVPTELLTTQTVSEPSVMEPPTALAQPQIPSQDVLQHSPARAGVPGPHTSSQPGLSQQIWQLLARFTGQAPAEQARIDCTAYLQRQLQSRQVQT